MGWKLVVAVAVLGTVLWFAFGRTPKELPYYETRGRRDLAELAKKSLVALEENNYVNWKATLAPGDAQRFGLSNVELRRLFSEYLSPAFQGGSGEYRLNLNLDQGVGTCERTFKVQQRELQVGASVSFQHFEGKWLYANTLYATLSNAWLLEGFREGKVLALPYSAVAYSAARDRHKLEALGLKHFPSSKPGVSVTWDQQIQALADEAFRRSGLRETLPSGKP